MKSLLVAAAAFAALSTRVAVADTLDWGQIGSAGSNVASPLFATSADGLVVMATSPGTNFSAATEGDDFAGEFTTGEHLLFDNDAPGSVTLTFSTPIDYISLAAQAAEFGSYTATLSLYDGSTLVGTKTDNGVNVFGPENTIAQLSYSGLITKAVISTTNDGGGLAIGTVTLDVSAAPEPASWALMIVGVGLVGGAWRRRAHGATALRSV